MDKGAGDAFMLTELGVTGLKAVKHLMRTAKGRNTRRRKRQSYRRSLGDDEFLGDEGDLLGDFMGDDDELLDFGDIADLGEEAIET